MSAETVTVFVPTCPVCKSKNTLIFVPCTEVGDPPPRFRCTRDAGGCGMFYFVTDIDRLYSEEERPVLYGK